MIGYEAAAARAYAEGRREQHCPECGREEASGSYCTACTAAVHPDQWVARVLSDAQVASRTVRSAQPVHAGRRKAPRTPERPPHPQPAPSPAPAGVLFDQAGLWPAP